MRKLLLASLFLATLAMSACDRNTRNEPSGKTKRVEKQLIQSKQEEEQEQLIARMKVKVKDPEAEQAKLKEKTQKLQSGSPKQLEDRPIKPEEKVSVEDSWTPSDKSIQVDAFEVRITPLIGK